MTSEADQYDAFEVPASSPTEPQGEATAIGQQVVGGEALPHRWRVEADGGVSETTIVVDGVGGPYLVAEVSRHWEDGAKVARLIAAAPRLLAALQEIVDTYEAGYWTSLNTRTAMEVIREATR